MKKLISIILVCIFSLSVLSSCDTNTPVDTEPDTTPDVDINDGTDEDTTPEPDGTYGTLTLTLPDTVYSNYPPVAIEYSFSDESKAEELTFTTSNSILKVENGKIYATGVFDGTKIIRVTAKSENFEASKTVRVTCYQGSTASGASLNIEGLIATRNQQIATRSGGDTDDCVLFVGDSFFNPDNWWTNFYTEFAGKKAYTVGISSSTTEDWQIVSERLVYPYAPKAVVVHCGTNDIFDDGDNASTTVASLKTLFETYHKRMPETKIYWFSIEPRVGKSFEVPKAVNESIEAYAEGKDWIVYIDSASWCFNSDGSVNAGFFKSCGIHPANESYAKYRQALVDAGITYEDIDTSKQTKIADITRNKSQGVENAATKIVYRGAEIKTEYVISGTMTLTDIESNGHAEFQFKDYQTRFLIWDYDSDKRLGVGWFIEDGTRVRDTDTADSEEFVFENTPLVIEWKLLFTEKNAYFYANGELKAVYYNVIDPTHLILSSQGMTLTFTDMTVYTKAADAAEYNAALAEVSAYEAEAGTTTRAFRV